MTVFFHPDVAGERCRIVALPDYSEKAVAAWKKFLIETRDSAGAIFGLDIEGTSEEGLGTYDPSIKTRLIQFGNHREAWVLDPADPRWRKHIVKLLKNPKARFVAHNAAYDATRVYFSFGIDLMDEGRIIDTLPMAQLCWPGQTKPKGLKPLSDEFIDTGLSEAEHRLHARFVDEYMAQKPRKTRLLPKNFEPGVSSCRRPKCDEPSWTGSKVGYCYEHYLGRKPDAPCKKWAWSNIALDNPEYQYYAGLDAIYVRRLLDIVNAEVKRRKMSKLSKTEQHVKRLMTATSRRGHRVDGEWTAEILDETEAEFSEAVDQIMDTTGLKPRSPKMMEWFAKRGVRTQSLDKDHLPKLIEKYGEEDEVGPVLHELQTVSSLTNLLSNLRIIFRHATEGDGFTHADIKTMQAHTGRMSATGPAMQTFAKKGEKGTRLRGCYVAREGHVLVGADYDSQEVRIAAAESRDEALLAIVLQGLNQHVLTAESLFDNWASKEENPDEYAKAKTLDFAQQYGARHRKLAKTLGISEAEALTLWSRWRMTYAGLVEWSDRMAKQRYVRNSYGRLIPRDPFRDFANANYMIQSTGRDVLGEALVRLANAGWGHCIWLPIHDELILEVPEDRADDGIAALNEHMPTTVRGIEIPAEGELVGTRWRGLG